jgi:hypothetical protein
VVHACNPSYSGGRDQEDCGSKQPRQIVHETLSQKTLHKNRAGRVAQVKALSSNSRTTKKKRKEKKDRKEREREREKEKERRKERKKIRNNRDWAGTVAHTCNPSYLGGKD